jgi:amylosucrase
VLIICNFNVETQALPIDTLEPHGFFNHGGMKDLCTGENVPVEDGQIFIPALSFYWLRD